MPQIIFFDESGFTGENLLNPQQPIFVYASVATSEEEAGSMIRTLKSTYGTRMPELKGAKLMKSVSGRKLVDEVFSYFWARSKISVSNKKYALAGKFYEYVFEPSLSQSSQLFYSTGFHLFISNMLYLHLLVSDRSAEQLLHDFEHLMRTRDGALLSSIFSTKERENPVLRCILELADNCVDKVREELGSLTLQRWILDLSLAALSRLLAHWSLEFDQITAICDPSKPLMEDKEAFSCMVDRKDKKSISFDGREHHPLTFNLSELPRFPSSVETPGLQIADILATVASHVFTNTDQNDPYARSWKTKIASVAHYGSVMPNLSAIERDNAGAILNLKILAELHRRSRNRENLTEGMELLVRNWKMKLRLDG